MQCPKLIAWGLVCLGTGLTTAYWGEDLKGPPYAVQDHVGIRTDRNRIVFDRQIPGWSSSSSKATVPVPDRPSLNPWKGPRLTTQPRLDDFSVRFNAVGILGSSGFCTARWPGSRGKDYCLSSRQTRPAASKCANRINLTICSACTRYFHHDGCPVW